MRFDIAYNTFLRGGGGGGGVSSYGYTWSIFRFFVFFNIMVPAKTFGILWVLHEPKLLNNRP